LNHYNQNLPCDNSSHVGSSFDIFLMLVDALAVSVVNSTWFDRMPVGTVCYCSVVAALCQKPLSGCDSSMGKKLKRLGQTENVDRHEVLPTK
jgi:hypothetical protein